MVRSTLLALASLAVGGCTLGDEPRPGTYVGNPGKITVRVGEPDGVVILEAGTERSSAHWLRCGGGFATSASEVTLDLWEPTSGVVPPGIWCGLVLAFDRSVVVSGTDDNDDFTYELSVDLPAVVTLWAAHPIEVDEHAFVLELGAPGWLDGEELPLEPGPNRFGADGEIGLWFASRLADSIVLHPDPDESGDLTEQERALEPVASRDFPPPAELDETTEGARVTGETGCLTVPGPTHGTPWALAIAGGLVLLRRRSEPNTRG